MSLTELFCLRNQPLHSYLSAKIVVSPHSTGYGLSVSCIGVLEKTTGYNGYLLDLNS